MKSSELLRKLRRAGWRVISQKGSHLKRIHPDRKDFIIFPDHGSNEIATGTEKAIRKQAGI